MNQQSLEFVEPQTQHMRIVPHALSTILMNFWPPPHNFLELEMVHSFFTNDDAISSLISIRS
jgi:hypothetical protein